MEEQLNFEFYNSDKKSIRSVLEDYLENRSTKEKILDFFQSKWWRIKDIYYNIRDFLFPRQMWVLDCLPNNWRDKDEVIRLVLFECVLNYIEEEKGLEWVAWLDEKEKGFKKKLVEIYSYIKFGREALNLQLNNSYPEKGEDGDYNVIYAEVNRIEGIIKEKDEEYLKWILENKGSLWV